MENQWLALGPLVVFDFAYENYVIAAIVLADAAADEMRGGALEQRAAGASFETFGIAEAILELGGELTREMMLAGREDTDGEMAGLGEIGEQRGIAREAPEHQRGIELD